MSAQLTPEQYRELLGLGTQNEELSDDVKMQMMLAKMMQPQGLEMRGNSRVQVAPHWMELIGQLAQQKAMLNMMEKSKESQKKIRTNSAAQNELILQALLPQPNAAGTAPPAGAGFQPPSGPEGFNFGPRKGLFGLGGE